MYKPKYIEKALFDEKEIDKQLDKAAIYLNNKFKNNKKPPIMVCVLMGACQFFSSLLKRIKFDVNLDFTTLKSYRGTEQVNTDFSKVINLSVDLKDRDVIIVEDISDTARTLIALIQNIKNQKPKSVTTMVLIDKFDCRKIPFVPDYACFKVEGNPFIIGYGIDWNELGRNLPYIGAFNKNYNKG